MKRTNDFALIKKVMMNGAERFLLNFQRKKALDISSSGNHRSDSFSDCDEFKIPQFKQLESSSSVIGIESANTGIASEEVKQLLKKFEG